MTQNDDMIIANLQIKLDLQTKENLNYINLITEQQQEIENLKSKIDFLERIVNLEKNNKRNNKNSETYNNVDNKSVISRMMSWISYN